MKLLNTYTLTIKKSKFIAYYYEVDNKNEVLNIQKELWENNKKARHIPYAYILDNTAGKSDDKEPSGTSGMPIYQVLERKCLTNKAIFVVRYFGGTKLGASNLTKTYREVANIVSESS